MARNPDHALLSPPTHDERLRQQFVFSFKRHVGSKVRPGNRTIYEKVAKPAFEKEEGRAPETTAEIGSVMWEQPSYQLFSAMNRNAQEMMWDSVADPIYRNRDRLSETYKKLNESGKTKGSLTLDPNFKVPKGIASVDIHLQPGGYAIDYGDDDVLAGAFYEGGGNLYSMSGGIGTTESKAEVIMRFLKERYPNFTPTKILDFACSAGSSSTPWALAFPDAKVHAIDVGAAMLRYAHGRAEALGAAVHFHQMDAEKTTFPDDSFDLVVSHNAMHEMSQKIADGMFRESLRLLKPGGIAIHQDVPLRFSELDTYTEWEYSWDQQHNNEPYWSTYASNDPKQMFIDAGFPEENVWFGKYEQLDKTVSWFVSAAQKPGG